MPDAVASTSTDTVTDEVDEEQSTKTENPWPHLEKYFKYTGRRHGSMNSAKFTCLLCAPLVKTVSAYLNSPSNLRKHIEVSLEGRLHSCLIVFNLQFTCTLTDIVSPLQFLFLSNF